MKKATSKHLLAAPIDSQGRLIIAPGFDYTNLRLPNKPIFTAVGKNSSQGTTATLLPRRSSIKAGSSLHGVIFQKPKWFWQMKTEFWPGAGTTHIGDSSSLSACTLAKSTKMGNGIQAIGTNGKKVHAGSNLRVGDGCQFDKLTCGNNLYVAGNRITIGELKAGDQAILKGTGESNIFIDNLNAGRKSVLAQVVAVDATLGTGSTIRDSGIGQLKSNTGLTIVGKTQIGSIKHNQLIESVVMGNDVSLPEEMDIFDSRLDGAIPENSTFTNSEITLHGDTENQVFMESRINSGTLKQCTLDTCQVSDCRLDDSDIENSPHCTTTLKNVTLAGSVPAYYAADVLFKGENKTEKQVTLIGQEIKLSAIPQPATESASVTLRKCRILMDVSPARLEAAGTRVTLDGCTLVGGQDQSIKGVIANDIQWEDAQVENVTRLSPEGQAPAITEQTDQVGQIGQAGIEQQPVVYQVEIDTDEINTLAAEHAESEPGQPDPSGLQEAMDFIESSDESLPVQQHESLADYDQTFKEG